MMIYQQSTPDTTTKPDIKTLPGTTFIVTPDDELEKPYRVMVENDDVTPMDFVVLILRMVFGLTYGRAMRVMLEAHSNGVAYVVTLPLAEAQQKIYDAHTIARGEGYPLSFYLEPGE